jgi:hypothetical protein
MTASKGDAAVRMSIPYNPSAQGVRAFVGIGAGLGVLHLFPLFQSRVWLGFGIGFILFAGLLFLRRAVWKRVLTVTDDALIVPTGFMRLRTVRAPFASIRHISVIQLYVNLLLQVRTDERTIEIMDLYLPDREVLFELKRILESSASASRVQ